MNKDAMTALATRLITENGHAATVTQQGSATTNGASETYVPGTATTVNVMVQENGTRRRWKPGTLEHEEYRKLLVTATTITWSLSPDDILTMGGVAWVIRAVHPILLQGARVVYEVEIDL